MIKFDLIFNVNLKKEVSHLRLKFNQSVRESKETRVIQFVLATHLVIKRFIGSETVFVVIVSAPAWLFVFSIAFAAT